MKLRIHTLLLIATFVKISSAKPEIESERSSGIPSVELKVKKATASIDPKLVELERQWIIELVKRRADAFAVFNLEEKRIESSHKMLVSGNDIEHTLKLRIPEDKKDEFINWVMGIRINPVSEESLLWNKGFSFEVIGDELVFTFGTNENED